MGKHGLVGIGRAECAALKHRAALDYQLGGIILPGGKGKRSRDAGGAAHYVNKLVFGGDKATVNMRRDTLVKLQNDTPINLITLAILRKCCILLRNKGRLTRSKH